jgi:hypothetical protein
MHYHLLRSALTAILKSNDNLLSCSKIFYISKIDGRHWGVLPATGEEGKHTPKSI